MGSGKAAAEQIRTVEAVRKSFLLGLEFLTGTIPKQYLDVWKTKAEFARQDAMATARGYTIGESDFWENTKIQKKSVFCIGV